VGRKAGLNDDKLRAVLGDDRAPFNDTERLVIELANAMTDTPSNVSDDLYARLREAFSEEQLMQLGAQIAFENYRADGIESSTSRATIFITKRSRHVLLPKPNLTLISSTSSCGFRPSSIVNTCSSGLGSSKSANWLFNNPELMK